MAVPRDIDPGIGKLDNVKLYNVEDVEKVISGNYKRRKVEALRARAIIDEEVEKYILGRKTLCV